MKLSEAIMMNGMCKPQGFGNESLTSIDAPCAIGGALQIIGKQSFEVVDNYWIFSNVWPWTEKIIDIPNGISVWGKKTASIGNIIWYLNDNERWSRSAIAEWVASVEPSESKEPVSAPDYQECNEAVVNVS